jgi:hypothetical protein
MDNDLLPDADDVVRPTVAVTNLDEPEDELQLTTEQEQKIKDLWNLVPGKPPGLKEITQAIFGDVDGRSREGRAIKQFLASQKLRARATSDPDKKPEIELNDAHQSYITNNAATMTSVEMARTLFHNPNLTNLNAETRAVNNFVKTLDTRVVFNASTTHDVPSGNYDPPNTFEKVFRKVNSYLNFSLDKDKMTPSQKKNLQVLINYLHTYRFVHQMNDYDSENDRKLCEDAFVRATYDKPDLMQEEVDQYIEYANQVVQSAKVLRRKNLLEDRLTEILQSTDVNDTKVHQGFSDALGKASTEYNQCQLREQKLLGELKEKRAARLSKVAKDTASVLNLIHDWKHEESRLEWIHHAELEQESLRNEVNRITSLPELKARILGLTKDEAVY